MKPLTASWFELWVALVAGMPYSDWMQAGVTAFVEQAEARAVRLALPPSGIGVVTKGFLEFGFGNL